MIDLFDILISLVIYCYSLVILNWKQNTLFVIWDESSSWESYGNIDNVRRLINIKVIIVLGCFGQAMKNIKYICSDNYVVLLISRIIYF